MMKTKLVIAAALLFVSTSSHADEKVQCRAFVDAKQNALVYSNLELNSNVGTPLPETCLSYFLSAGQKEILPVLLGVPVTMIMTIKVLDSEQMTVIDQILSTTPRTKTKIEIRSYLGADDNGMNDIKATLSAKPNYNEPAKKE